MTGMFLAVCALAAGLAAPVDTLVVGRLDRAPVLDGRIAGAEYGAVAVSIPTSAGAVQVRVGWHGDYMYIAAELPDSTCYWGDDLVISLDPDGSGGAAPDAGDRQWYIRRLLDSTVVSVVTTATRGRWLTPGVQPAALGAVRGGADWDVAAVTSPRGWAVELRVRTSAVQMGGAAPRIAVRTFNDAPQGWWSWPAPPAGMRPTRVEHTPDLWAPLVMR